MMVGMLLLMAKNIVAQDLRFLLPVERCGEGSKCLNKSKCQPFGCAQG